MLLRELQMSYATSLKFSSILSRVFPVFLLTLLSFSNAINADTEFLPVEEAYPLSVTQEGKKLTIQWQAAEGYYLYAHKIKAKYLKDGQLVPLDLDIPKGKIKFDPNFNEELEVHYNTLNVTAMLDNADKPVHLSVKSQGCADAGLCYPPQTQYFSNQSGQFVELTKDTFNSQTNGNISNAMQNPASNEEPPLLLGMMIGAFIGGLILNLMPCVFPVLSLKALSLAHGDAKTHHRNGWAYTGGVVISFLLVAFIIIIAKSMGSSLGWGFQLQQPLFVVGMIYLFVLLGLNLSGLFEMGTSLMGVGNNLTQGDSASASFFTGVLAAVVASPCTAPFMATAVGFAVTQSAVTAILVFSCLGLGLAAPYLLLAYLPAVANRMPNPGPWMERLKQFLAFPMFLTSAWLIGVLGNQTSSKTVAFVVAGIIAMAFAIWVLQGRAEGLARWINRAAATAAGVAAIFIAVKVDTLDNQEDSPWIDYSAETIAEFRSQKKAIFVDLTADWCITCKMNEGVAIERDAVHSFAEENGIAMVKGDWTKNDPRITEYLASFGRNGVPLYVMYPSDPSKEPQILPQILTEDIVLDAMKQSIQ